MIAEFIVFDFELHSYICAPELTKSMKNRWEIYV